MEVGNGASVEGPPQPPRLPVPVALASNPFSIIATRLIPGRDSLSGLGFQPSLRFLNKAPPSQVLSG